MKQNLLMRPLSLADCIRMTRRSANVIMAVTLVMVITTSLFPVEISGKAIVISAAAAVVLDLVFTALIGLRHGRV